MTGKHGLLRERFWRYVRQGEECWEWTGARTKDGYGYLRERAGTKKAHRVSWQLANGPIPEGGYVLHSCDHPWCVNPAHLRIGTQRENMREAGERGRMGKAHGERHYRAKLSAVVVARIRALHELGIADADIARNFGVAHVTIWRVVTRQSWKHVA